ncbi:MAG TPA: nucleotidyltransferase domain-containing protein [Conexibacter sp.]|jgi:predicted nucleotidyltransferase|nr:nucleotidyltransferase domain-containing protein [Conexibacter sp.]
MSAPLPTPISRIAADLAGLPGVLAVMLGGSRATATHRPDSDWDLGVYYRGSQRPLDPADLRRLGYVGYVSELGEWGPIVNGGAWLTVASTPVDVLYRDLDTVEGWLQDAQDGRFEVLSQNGYVAGAPTYVPVGELALARPISGSVPRSSFPDRLAETAPERWKGRASVSLVFARGYARAGDGVCCTGMLSNAVLCVAHARLAERREWVLNEKRLVARAALDDAHALLARTGETASALEATVVNVSDLLHVPPLTIR